MNLNNLTKQVEKLLVDNMPTILTGVGVVGTVGTAYLTAKATFKSAKIISDAQFKENAHATGHELTNGEKAKLVWMQYLPPIATGSITILSIVAANRISAKRAAALAAAYSITEGRFSDYKDKVREKLGLQKEEKLRAEIAQEKMDENPPPSTLVIASGKVMFRDEHTLRYFESTMEDVRKAENYINRRLSRDEYATLSQFYVEIGLEPTTMSETFGWHIDDPEPFEIEFSTIIAPDGKPCITIDYVIHPLRTAASKK